MDELQQPTGALDSCNSQQNHLYHANGDSVGLQALGLNSNHTNEHVTYTSHANNVAPSSVMNGEAMVVVDPKTKFSVTNSAMDEKPKNKDDNTIQIRDLKGSWDEEVRLGKFISYKNVY